MHWTGVTSWETMFGVGWDGTSNIGITFQVICKMKCRAEFLHGSGIHYCGCHCSWHISPKLKRFSKSFIIEIGNIKSERKLNTRCICLYASQYNFYQIGWSVCRRERVTNWWEVLLLPAPGSTYLVTSVCNKTTPKDLRIMVTVRQIKLRFFITVVTIRTQAHTKGSFRFRWVAWPGGTYPLKTAD